MNITKHWHTRLRLTKQTLFLLFLCLTTLLFSRESLAWSWIAPPRLTMKDLKPSYDIIPYDTAQRAYVVPREGRGPFSVEFTLKRNSSEAPLRIVNPAFVIKDWGESDFIAKVDGKAVQRGKDFRAGFEQTPTGKDLILWFNLKSRQETTFSIEPDLN
jgi:hypothetical protein